MTEEQLQGGNEEVAAGERLDQARRVGCSLIVPFGEVGLVPRCWSW